MVEEQHLDHRLQQVHEVVVPSDVGQLVGQQRVELQRGKPAARQHADRDENHGPPPADDGGHRDQRRREQPNGLADAKPRCESGECLQPGLGDGTRSDGPQALRRQPPPRRVGRHEQYADKP